MKFNEKTFFGGVELSGDFYKDLGSKSVLSNPLGEFNLGKNIFKDILK